MRPTSTSSSPFAAARRGPSSPRARRLMLCGARPAATRASPVTPTFQPRADVESARGRQNEATVSTILRRGLPERRVRPPHRPTTRGRRAGGAGGAALGQVPPPPLRPPRCPPAAPLARQSRWRPHPRTRSPLHHRQPPVCSTHRPDPARHARRPSPDRPRALLVAGLLHLLSSAESGPPRGAICDADGGSGAFPSLRGRPRAH